MAHEDSCRCWRCGHVVTPDNDAAATARSLVQAGHPVMVPPFNRHLNPVTNARGIVVCEGTPAIADQLAKMRR